MGLRLTSIELGEFFQQLFLPGPKIGGGFHHDANELVAAPPTAQIDDALSPEPKDPARLRAGRHLHFDLAFQRGSLDIGPERGLGKADGQLADHLVVLPLKKRVLSYLNGDVQVAGNTAGRSGFSFSTQLEPRTGVHSTRNFNLEVRRFRTAPVP